MPRQSGRKKVSKAREYPVISPTKGTERVKRYAVAINASFPITAYRAPTDDASPDITQLHQRIPSDLTPEDWDILHNKLGAAPIIPESPPRMATPSPRHVNVARKIKIPTNSFENHVHDSEDESYPCVHCL